jgi:hypothetical protein
LAMRFDNAFAIGDPVMANRHFDDLNKYLLTK